MLKAIMKGRIASISLENHAERGDYILMKFMQDAGNHDLRGEYQLENPFFSMPADTFKIIPRTGEECELVVYVYHAKTKYFDKIKREDKVFRKWIVDLVSIKTADGEVKVNHEKSNRQAA